MKRLKLLLLAGILAALLLSGCGVPDAERAEEPIPEEYQQNATILFEP